MKIEDPEKLVVGRSYDVCINLSGKSEFVRWKYLGIVGEFCRFLLDDGEMWAIPRTLLGIFNSWRLVND